MLRLCNPVMAVSVLAIVAILSCPVDGTVASGKSVRLVRSKPLVYITLERIGARTPLYLNESNVGAWLRLHNNSRWPVALAVGGIEKEYGEALVPYDVVIGGARGGDVVPRGYALGDAHTEVTLVPGRSIVFSVPREHLAAGASIRVPFNFPWDRRPGYAGYDDEVEHYVRFALD